MGLSILTSLYIAFRAGRRLRQLTSDNWKEKLVDFSLDYVNELIWDKLEELLETQGVRLPAQVSIQDVASHIHGDNEDLSLLDTIFN